MGEAGKFSCGQCNKTYSWKPELAGRRVKCKCGHALSVPTDDPAAADALPPEFEDLYALAQGAPVEEAYTPPPINRAACPSCGAGVDAGAVLCVSCGHNLKTGKKVKTKRVAGGGGGAAVATAPALAGGGRSGAFGYPGARRRPDDDNRGDGNVFYNPVKDLYIPAGLALFGIVLSFFTIVYGYGVKSPGVAIMAVGLLTLLNVVLIVPGILVAVKVLDAGLGPIGPAMAKLIACAIAPGAIGEALKMAFTGSLGTWVAGTITLIVALVIFMKLLDWDLREMLTCAGILWAIRTWLTPFIFLAVMAALSSDGNFGKAARALAGGRLTLAGEVYNSEDDEEALDNIRARQSDDETIRLLHSGGEDAKAWIAAAPTRTLGDLSRQKSEQVLSELYFAGAQEIRVFTREFKGREVAEDMVVIPPDGDKKAARGPIVSQLKSLAKTLERVTPRDRGEKYWRVLFLTPDDIAAAEPPAPKRSPAKGQDDEGDDGNDGGKQGPRPPPPLTAAQQIDQHAKAMIAAPDTDVAEEWVVEGANYFYGFDHDKSIEIVKTLVGFGCANLYAADIGVIQDNVTCADALVFTLPTTAEARAQVFEYYGKLNALRQGDFRHVLDEGQTQFVLVFINGFRNVQLGEYHPKPRKSRTATTAPAATAPVAPK